MPSLTPVRIARDIRVGTLPSERRPGLRDPNPGEPGADRFAPFYTLVINGRELKLAAPEVTDRITEVTYEDNEELFDTLTITLEGFITDPRKNIDIPVPEWVQSESIFSEGNFIWLFGGYGFNTQLIGGAEVVKREFEYGVTPRCKIICYEPIHRLTQVYSEGRPYPKMRASGIARFICRKKEYNSSALGGAIFNVSNIQTLPILTTQAENQKQGESDYDFLKRLADVRGWKFFTKFDADAKAFNVFYGPDPDKQEIMYRYLYNPGRLNESNVIDIDNVLEFTPEISVLDQNSEIRVVAIDEKKKKKIDQKFNFILKADGFKIGTDSRRMVGDKGEFQAQELQNPTAYRFDAFGISRRIIATRPFKDEAAAKHFIVQLFRNHIKHFISATGKVSGNETLQSRQVHAFLGLGETFSGTESKPAKWYLTKVTHTFSGSGGDLAYMTDFSARKVIDWIPPDDIRANPPAQIKKKKQDKALSLIAGGGIPGL